MLALINPADLGSWFQRSCLILGAVLLVWNTIEVGRNDAANLVNAVFGAGVMRRRPAVMLAGTAVVLGAALGSAVIDTARKGIFDPAVLGDGTIEAALSIFAAVYIVNTVLLYCYSAFGMPVSTTACLVFALLGGALGIDPSAVNWDKAGMVLIGIICSIVLSGFVSFFIQRAARGAIRDRATHLPTLLLHGGWVGGGVAAGLLYFLLIKGMKSVGVVQQFNAWLHELEGTANISAGDAPLVLFLWGVCAITIHAILVLYRKRAAKLLFPVLAVLGMLAMGFAFGQNDLANCASPGLATYALLEAQDPAIGSEVGIAWWLLLGCGLLLFAGMNSKNADRVTKAEVSTGSMGDHVALWAPRWCVALASRFLDFRGSAPALAPRSRLSPVGKTMHYDTLRACVITSVSASIISTASSLGLPVSTTYVAFAAVVATGMADRIFQRGDAALKLGRAIWVVTSWVLSALVAAAGAFVVAMVIYRCETWGIVACLLLNLFIRNLLKKRADRLARRVEEEAYERAHPEEFAGEDY